MRRLTLVPILHTPGDLGSMAPAVEARYVGRHGQRGWAEHSRLVGALWETIRQRVLALDVPRARLRIYQDGLPVCGREREIVAAAARAGSDNFSLVAELVESGAQLEGTEDPALLLREVELMGQISAVRDPDERRRLAEDHESWAPELLDARDRFVADRIALTLRPAERGLLFMGLAHQVERHLAPDIAVGFLLPEVCHV